MTDNHVASLIIIGDEILRGQVQDTNTIYLAKSLQTIGIKIKRIVVIPDEIDVIAKEVSEASKTYPIVFTSGGVGPTHDDLTFEGVAKGLGLTLKEDKGLLEHLIKLFPNQPESRRLATLPSPCDLIYAPVQNTKDTFAVVKANNVYILPGSPPNFRPAVDEIISRLERGQLLHNDYLDLRLDEFAIVTILDEQAKHWSGKVAIGSYPQSDTEPRTRISFESNDREAIVKAKNNIIEMLSPGAIVNGTSIFDEEYAKRVYQNRTENKHLKKAFEIIEECYSNYGANEVFISFNGGKDCTVVLHLAATLAKLRKHDPPLCLYVTGDAFPEVAEFVANAASYYGLELVLKKGPIQQALTTLLVEKPTLKACLLGTRKGDPGAHSLESFAPTDPGWPELMRVSPIIDWSYSQVWQFLLKHEVPYCSLYDEGYTSLGARDTTTKNPFLRDPNNPSNYLPAHTLADDSAERHGRG